MRLLTNNPSKRAGLEGYGLSIVERVPLETRPNDRNIEYLRTKREKMGHLLSRLEGDAAPTADGLRGVGGAHDASAIGASVAPPEEQVGAGETP